MDALDLFSAEPETYCGSLWLYQSTKGVVSYAFGIEGIDTAEQLLRDRTELPLEFTPEAVTAADMYKARRNVAVVTRDQTGNVMSHAPLPDNWFPPGDPRRRK